ncbi:MAG: tRNA epoxyqueuosine(34) reductase QueG [Crocinitomicaceae bacterium]|nr:tRNA epoxyqueuosine(34) reductase QueG [Crocinitomicaceae bacterium]
MRKSDITIQIKKKAQELGFFSCGISKAEFLEDEAAYLERWLKNGMQGKMHYMENHFDKRLNPALLVDGAKSVVSVLLNYFPKEDIFKNERLKISKYAYGEDYHLVIKEKLSCLTEFIKGLVGDLSIRSFTDSAPVLEKAWAKKAGLGWIGKNGNLITQKVGSFYFLGEIILDLELDYDGSTTDHCGTCTRCIDACPTEAIVQPYIVDGSKCISYLTIELKDQFIPIEFAGKMQNWVYGCDVCQDVCPWNSFATPTNESSFEPNAAMNVDVLSSLTEDQFKNFFKFSPIKRAKYEGLIRNIQFLDSEKK